MNVLIACERSGTVRDAFQERGFRAVSCDIEAAAGDHLEGDVRDIMHSSHWDLVIAFPPCTHLSASGARYWKEKQADGRQQEAEEFFLAFTRLKCRWAIENPIGRMSTRYRKPDQIIQPWQFGHGETKATCLWLSGLPKLEPTDIVEGRSKRLSNLPPSPDRSWIRSITYPGIAEAMASQWGATR